MYQIESCFILCCVFKGQSKRCDIQLDISAPRFLVPESFQDSKASVVSGTILSRVKWIDFIILVNRSVSQVRYPNPPKVVCIGHYPLGC